MKQVKVTDFRAHLPKYLAEAQAGETITIVSHGTPIVRLVPAGAVAGEAKKRLRRLQRKARIGDVITPLDVIWRAADGRP